MIVVKKVFQKRQTPNDRWSRQATDTHGLITTAQTSLPPSVEPEPSLSPPPNKGPALPHPPSTVSSVRGGVGRGVGIRTNSQLSLPRSSRSRRAKTCRQERADSLDPAAPGVTGASRWNRHTKGKTASQHEEKPANPLSCNLCRACDGAKQRGLSMGWESSTDETAFQIVQERRAAPLEFLKRAGAARQLACFCFTLLCCDMFLPSRLPVPGEGETVGGEWLVHLREWPGGASRCVMALKIATGG